MRRASRGLCPRRAPRRCQAPSRPPVGGPRLGRGRGLRAVRRLAPLEVARQARTFRGPCDRAATMFKRRSPRKTVGHPGRAEVCLCTFAWREWRGTRPQATSGPRHISEDTRQGAGELARRDRGLRGTCGGAGAGDAAHGGGSLEHEFHTSPVAVSLGDKRRDVVVPIIVEGGPTEGERSPGALEEALPDSIRRTVVGRARTREDVTPGTQASPPPGTVSDARRLARTKVRHARPSRSRPKASAPFLPEPEFSRSTMHLSYSPALPAKLIVACAASIAMAAVPAAAQAPRPARRPRAAADTAAERRADPRAARCARAEARPVHRRAGRRAGRALRRRRRGLGPDGAGQDGARHRPRCRRREASRRTWTTARPLCCAPSPA